MPARRCGKISLPSSSHHRPSCNCKASQHQSATIQPPQRERANSMFIVSTDILRVSGYTNQFKNLLSGRTRRESYQDGSHGALATHTPGRF
ncbi:hypothetical protein M3Y94_00426600 [Aphelenchoides besseyi]|nr:hypothetical protein M3Y94_00426600 [Aphelenchoides besseyi]